MYVISKQLQKKKEEDEEDMILDGANEEEELLIPGQKYVNTPSFDSKDAHERLIKEEDENDRVNITEQ